MIEIVSERSPGGRKIKKPEELHGVRSVLSYKWGGATFCQIFKAGNDMWVHHKDWCSLVLYGAEAPKAKKFIYNDSFSSPAVRGEAWIRFKDIFKYERKAEVLHMLMQECLIDKTSRFCHDDYRMFVDVYLAFALWNAGAE